MGTNKRNLARILIVDDDDAIRVTLAEGLALDGYTVRSAVSVTAAKRDLVSNRADLILLDLNLPDDSGYELLRAIRARTVGDGAINSDVAVIMVSGRSSEIDRIRAFELGCDDYVVKPFSFTELRGRIAAVLRRGVGDRHFVQTVGELTIDRRSHKVTVAGLSVKLTLKEYSLLLALAEDPRRVFKRQELLRSVWGYQSAGSTRTLDAHACRLRAKLAGGRYPFVTNVWGVGYRLANSAPSEGEE